MIMSRYDLVNNCKGNVSLCFDAPEGNKFPWNGSHRVHSLIMISSHGTSSFRSAAVVEPLLSGIVLGLIPITLAGLFVAAYIQYKRGNELGL